MLFFQWFSRIILDLYDALSDLQYTKKLLGKSCRQIVLNNNDFTGTEACRYFIIEKVFDNISLVNDHHILDVGCGRGRILAYLRNHHFQGRLTGIEINPIAYQSCASWALKQRIELIQDNVFNISVSSYNVFVIGHSFYKEMFHSFIKKIEKEVSQQILLICIIDLDYGSYLEGMTKWKLLHRSTLFKHKGLYLIKKPNRYSIWSFNPQ